MKQKVKAKLVILSLVVESDSTPTKYGNRTVWHNAAGQRHRLDGPALEWASGSKQWFVDDKCVPVDNQQEFEQWLRDNYENEMLGIKI